MPIPKKASLRDTMWDLQPAASQFIPQDRATEAVVRVTASQMTSEVTPDRLYSVSKVSGGVIVTRVA